VICDLPGHHVSGWDERMRPIPENVRIVGLERALAQASQYDCIIGHNITDLLAVKHADGPARILVLHSSLDGRIAEERSSVDSGALRAAIEKYLALVRGRLVVISEMKAESWGLAAEVIPGAVDIDDYGSWEGCVASGLRVANHVGLKAAYLLWPFHEAIFQNELPCRLVGVNPDRDGVEPARNWDDLKRLYREHRFFVHTAAPGLEDGYNLASLEAMAAGLPLVCNAHPSCPVEDGRSGIVSDSPEILREGVRRLLAEPELARTMGEAGREIVHERFSMPAFIDSWQRVIEEASASRA